MISSRFSSSEKHLPLWRHSSFHRLLSTGLFLLPIFANSWR